MTMTYNDLPFLVAPFAALFIAVPALAADDAGNRDAAAHYAVFDAGSKIGLSPQYIAEELECAAYWNRWAYVVESAADPAFVNALHPDLSVANAKKRAIEFQRLARRSQNEMVDAAEYAEYKAEAEADADKLYAAYANNEERGFETFMQSLGICR